MPYNKHMSRGKRSPFNQTRQLKAGVIGAFLPKAKFDSKLNFLLVGKDALNCKVFEREFIPRFNNGIALAVIMIASRANSNQLSIEQLSKLEKLWQLHKNKGRNLDCGRLEVESTQSNIKITRISYLSPTGGGITANMAYKLGIEPSYPYNYVNAASITKSSPNTKMPKRPIVDVVETKLMLEFEMPISTRDNISRAKFKVMIEDILQLRNYDWSEDIIENSANTLHRDLRSFLSLTPDEALAHCGREYTSQFLR